MVANRIGLLLLVLPLTALAEDRPQPGTEGDTWSKYDFVPGAKLVFFEDFIPVDKKPSPLKHLKDPSPRLDVQDHAGGKWLRCRPPCTFDVVLPEALPDRFTVDFDLDGPGGNGLRFNAVKLDGSAASAEPAVYADSSQSTLAYGDGGDRGRSNEIDRIAGLDVSKPLHFSWTFDGAKVKGYAAQLPGLDVPNLKMPRTARLHFELVGGDDPDLIDKNIVTWVTNLRIAAGGNPVLLDELTKKGRIVLNGILFDTGKDRIRPESTPTLVAVAKLMTEHAELKLVVEGHTDNQGVAAANQTLSDKRAAAVKAWLVAHKIPAPRLESKGLGQTKPVGTNDTAEGRQANRRVELVRR
jgi:outer membrane protein OmpA-like peptidoglycan-associated protein